MQMGDKQAGADGQEKERAKKIELHREQDDPVGLLEERADLASSFAGQPDLSLAGSQSGDDIAPVKLQPQQIHSAGLSGEDDTPVKREDYKNSKEASADEVEVEDRILAPVKTKSELLVGKEPMINSSKMDYTQQKVTLQHIDDGSSHAMRLAQSAGGGPKSLAGSRSGTVTGAESAAFGGGNLQAESDHTIGSKTALQGLLPGRVALRGAIGNIAIDFMHDELDGNVRGGYAASTVQKSGQQVAVRHQKLSYDKNKTFLDHDKFERACCPKEGEALSRQPPLTTVNYNQIKFDPTMKDRPQDFSLWVNSCATRSVRASATRHRQQFQHRQFVSRVANQSKSQALSRHRGFHTNLYRTKEEHRRKFGVVDEDAVSLTAQTNTEEDVMNLEAGIVNNLKQKRKKTRKAIPRPKGGRRLKSANATSVTAKVSKAKYGLQPRKQRITSLNSNVEEPVQESQDYQEAEPRKRKRAGPPTYPHSLFVQTKTQERMQYADGTAAISDLASSGEGLHPPHQATIPGLAASNSAANSIQSKNVLVPASGLLTAPNISSTDGKLSSRHVGVNDMEKVKQGNQLLKRGSMPVLDPPLVAGSALLAAKLAGSAQVIGPNVVDMADFNDSASPQSPADQLRGSKLEPMMLPDIEPYLAMIAETEARSGPEGSLQLVETLKRLEYQELEGVEAQIDFELQKGAAGGQAEGAEGTQEVRSKHLKQLLKATNDLRRELRVISEDSGVRISLVQDGAGTRQENQANSRAESRNNQVAESRTQLENRYLRSSAQPQVLGLPAHAGRAAVMVSDGSQDYLASQALPNSHSYIGLQGNQLQADLSRQAIAYSRKQNGTGDRVRAATGSLSSNYNSNVNLANSAGLTEPQDGAILKSHDVTSGLSGGTASNSRIQQSPTKLMQEQSGVALALSHQTQKMDQPQSQDNLLDVNSSRKGPMSPLRVVVSSTTKVPDLLASQYGLAQPSKNMLKVQNIINSQGKQYNFNQNDQRRSLQHKVSNQRPKRNARLATAKVRGTNHLKSEEACGPRASHIVMKDYKSGAQMTQEYLDITLLGGEPRSSGAMTSKAATNPMVRLHDTTSDSKTGYLAGADLSEVDPSRIQTSSQRLLGFNVEEEYRLHQQKLQLEEEGHIYRYNLDRSNETGAGVHADTDAVTPSHAGQGSSCLNIATFASNAKGKMEIKPAKSEKAQAAKPISKNIISPKIMRSQKEFVVNNRLAPQGKGGKKQTKSLTKVCQSFVLTNMKLHDLQNRHRDPSEPEFDLSANIAIRQLEGIKAPLHFHHLASFQVYQNNLRSPSDHVHSSPTVKIAGPRDELGLAAVSDGHQVVAKLPHMGEPREPWSGTLRRSGALQLQQSQHSGTLKLAQRKGSTPGTAQLGAGNGTTFERSRGSSPVQVRSTQRRDSHVSRGSKRRKKSTGHQDSPEAFARTQVEKFSSLDPQACPPQYQRFESFGRHPPELAQTATYVNSDQELGATEPKLAVITAPNIIIPQMQTHAGSFVLNHTQTEKASDPSSTLKQAFLFKQTGTSPSLGPLQHGIGLATQSGFAVTQSGFGASQQSFQIAEVGNIGRLMPQILKQRELNQTEDLNRHPDTEKTHLVQISQEDELNRSQHLQGDFSTQKKHSVDEMTRKTDELKEVLKDAINIQDDVHVEEGPKQNKVAVDVQGMKRKSTEEELEESSSLQYAEGIQMHQKPINDKVKKSIDSLNDMDPDGEHDSPSPARIPKARYTSIRPDDDKVDPEPEGKRHSQPITTEKPAVTSGRRSGRPSVRHLKNNSFRDASRVEQRKGLATNNEVTYNIEPLGAPDPQKKLSASGRPVDSKASDEKSQRRYASKSLSSKSVHTRGKKASSPLSALKPYTQVGPSPISAVDSPPNAAVELNNQNIITVVNGMQLPHPDTVHGAGERAREGDYDQQLFHFEQAHTDHLASGQNQLTPDLDPYAVNALSNAQVSGHMANESNQVGVAPELGGLSGGPNSKWGHGTTSETENHELLQLASLDGVIATAPDHVLVQRTESAGGHSTSYDGAASRPRTAPFKHKLAGTAKLAKVAEGNERIVFVKSPKADKLENEPWLKKAGVFHPSRSDSRMGSSYKAGSLRRLHSSGKYEEFSVAEMSAQVMLDQHDGTTDFSQLQASKPLAAGSLLSPPCQMMPANLNATQQLANQNIITINSVGKTDLNDRASEFDEERLGADSQRIKRGLYEILLHALQDRESKKRNARSQLLEKSVANFIFRNQAEISRLLARLPASSKQYKYYEKQLSANPQQDTEKNVRGLRRQDDKDVFLRHIQNDKESQLGRTQFGVQGRRLYSIRQNILQHQICSFIEEQVRILRHAHARQESMKGKSSFKVDLQGNNLISSWPEQFQEVPHLQDYPGSTMMNSTRRTVILNQRLNESVPGDFSNQVQHLFTALGQGVAENPETLTGGLRGEINTATPGTGTQATIQNTRPPTENRTHHIKVERPNAHRHSQNSLRGQAATRMMQPGATSRSRMSRSRETSSFAQMPRDSVQINKKDGLGTAINSGLVRSSGSRDVPYTSSVLTQPPDQVKSVRVPASPRSKGRRTFSRVKKQERRESVGPGADLVDLEFSESRPGVQSTGVKSTTGPRKISQAASGPNEEEVAQQVTGVGILKSTRMEEDAEIVEALELKEESQEAPRQRFSNQIALGGQERRHSQVRQSSGESGLFHREESGRSPYQSEVYNSSIKALSAVAHTTRAGQVRHSVGSFTKGSGVVEAKPNLEDRPHHAVLKSQPTQEGIQDELSVVKEQLTNPVKKIHIRTSREQQASPEPVSKEAMTRSSRDAQLGIEYPNIEKGLLSKTAGSAKMQNEQNADQIVTLPLHLISQRNVSNLRNPREKNHVQSLSMRNDQDEKFVQAVAQLHPNHNMVDKNMLLQDQEQQKKAQRSRQANAAATKTSKESLKKMTINESEQQISNYRITRPVMEGSPMAFAGYGTGNSNELTEKMLLGAMSPPSAASGKQALVKRPSPAYGDIFDSKNNIKKPEELQASAEQCGKSNTEGSLIKGKEAFKTLGSSKSDGKDDHHRSHGPQAIDESQQIKARQALKPNEKMQLTVNLNDPRMANAQLQNVTKQGRRGLLSQQEEQKLQKLSRSSLMEKIGKSFQTQGFNNRTQAELREQQAHQKKLQQARKALAVSHGQAATKAVVEAPGVFDTQISQTNLLMNKTSRLNQRLMRGPGGPARNVIGSLAAVNAYIAPGSANLPAYMPPGVLNQQNQGTTVMPHQRQVNYLIKNPTAHEISDSRLIEISRVRHQMPSGNFEAVNQPVPKPSRLHAALPSRVKSAIHRGHVGLTYGVQEPRKPSAGLINYHTEDRAQICKRSSAKYALYSKQNFDIFGVPRQAGVTPDFQRPCGPLKEPALGASSNSHYV